MEEKYWYLCVVFFISVHFYESRTFVEAEKLPLEQLKKKRRMGGGMKHKGNKRNIKYNLRIKKKEVFFQKCSADKKTFLFSFFVRFDGNQREKVKKDWTKALTLLLLNSFFAYTFFLKNKVKV